LYTDNLKHQTNLIFIIGSYFSNTYSSILFETPPKINNLFPLDRDSTTLSYFALTKTVITTTKPYLQKAGRASK